MATTTKVALKLPVRKLAEKYVSLKVNGSLPNIIARRASNSSGSLLSNFKNPKWKPVKIGGVVAVGVATVFVGTAQIRYSTKSHLSTTSHPAIPPNSVPLSSPHGDLKLTLYQFKSCPFCNKVRAYLDYRGLPYDVVEVNYLRRRDMKKWAASTAVPLLVAQQGDNDTSLQINESTMIMSLLESFRHDPTDSLTDVMTFYPTTEKAGRFGKKKLDYENKYFIMFKDDPVDDEHLARLQEERQWRQWVDEHFLRLIPPNIYRSVSEAFDSVRTFEQLVEGERSLLDHCVYLYAGAPAMFVMGKMLKRKYKLHDDVRTSLYQACNLWTKALGKKRPFLGGQEPNLADLAVYGALRTIEGCQAFSDVRANTKISPWYDRMKVKVTSHAGAASS